MKLTAKTKPRRLTLGQMWELYRTDTGEETPENIIRVLDTFFSGYDRDDMNIIDKFGKYRQARFSLSDFTNLLKGMVGDGDK